MSFFNQNYLVEDLSHGELTFRTKLERYQSALVYRSIERDRPNGEKELKFIRTHTPTTPNHSTTHTYNKLLYI